MCLDQGESIVNWILFFVMLTPTGEFYNEKIDSFDNMDDCYYTMEEIASQFPDNEPWNWDFVCLQDSGIAA